MIGVEPCYRIEMLGGFAVFQGGRRLDRLPTQKTEALLAYVALRIPRGTAREVLMDALWQEGEPSAIRHRLNQAVWTIRRWLDSPECPANTVLVSQLQTLSINGDVVTTDVIEFEKALAAARSARTREERLRNLERAVGIYKGDLLEEHYDEWILLERLRLADACTEALGELVRLHSRAGEPEEAIRYVYRLLRHDPHSPEHHTNLVDLYLRAGRAASAHQHYEEALLLMQSAGREPSQRFLNLGRRALSEARRLSADALPPARRKAKVAARTILPKFWDSCFGREGELDSIERSLEGGRAVTLLGIGGSGKTRLAIEAATRLRDRYPGGVIFVGIKEVEGSDTITREALRTIAPGADTSEERPLRVLGRHLPANERALFVLDSMELLANSGAPELRALLEALPHVRLLCTSRIPLDVPGETQIAIGPLPVPEESESPAGASLLLNPSVALFVARAKSVWPDFALNDRNREDVAKLCRKLEGLPLALELAAGWARTLTPRQTLERFVERYDRIESRRKEINPRHRSMWAAIEGSFALLPPEIQEAFLRLSVFHGGWDHAAAAHLCPTLDAVAMLEVLASSSMVTADASREPVRFAMLDALRSFARDHLSSALERECRWLHAEYFVELARSAHAGPSREFALRIGEEYLNLVAALHWLRDNGHTGRAIELATALTPYWEMRGKLSEGLVWLDTLLERGDAVTPIERARARAASGRLMWQRGEFASATRRLNEALPTILEEGSPSDVLQLRFALQFEAHRVGDYEREIALLQDNLTLAITIGDHEATARGWNSMGNASMELRRWDEARHQYELSLEAARRGASTDRGAAARINLGKLALLRGETALGCEWLDEALELLRQGGHRWHTATALLYRAKAHTMMDEAETALIRLAEAYSLAPEQSVLRWRIVVQGGCALARHGDDEAAAMLFGLAERLSPEIEGDRESVENPFWRTHVDLVRSRLTAEKFEASWNRGRCMTPDEVAERLVRNDSGELILI